MWPSFGRTLKQGHISIFVLQSHTAGARGTRKQSATCTRFVWSTTPDDIAGHMRTLSLIWTAHLRKNAEHIPMTKVCGVLRSTSLGGLLWPGGITYYVLGTGHWPSTSSTGVGAAFIHVSQSISSLDGGISHPISFCHIFEVSTNYLFDQIGSFE